MKKYCIRPIWSLLKNDSAPVISRAALQDLTNKINKNLKFKLNTPAQQHSIIVEEQYLKIIQVLRKALGDRKTLTKQAVITLVDDYLRARGYIYDSCQHPRAHDNFFWHDWVGRTSVYDLAYYHKHYKRAVGKYHHSHPADARPSIFYFRCELDHRHRLLFGNLQIDSKSPANWEVPALGKILLNTKNIELMLVQAALQHAADVGASEIMFHAGDSASWAQFNKPGMIPGELVTSENYACALKFYEGRAKALAQLRPGDVVHHTSGNYIVFKNTGQQAQLYKLVFNEYDITNELCCQPLVDSFSALQRIKDGITRGFSRENLPEIIFALEDYLRCLKIPVGSFSQAAKFEFFAKELAESPAAAPDRANERAGQIVSKFYRAFGYEAQMLENYPAVKRYKNENTNMYFYINEKRIFRHKTLCGAALKPPQIGQRYYFGTGAANDLGTLLVDNNRLNKIYYWYEYKLPKLLNSLGVDCAKTEIVARRGWGQKPIVSEAWVINSGLAEAYTRPYFLF